MKLRNRMFSHAINSHATRICFVAVLNEVLLNLTNRAFTLSFLVSTVLALVVVHVSLLPQM